jgi:hypothetical protein
MPLDKPVKKKRRTVIKWKQVLAIAALFVFFSPFIPSRRRPFHSNFPTDWFDYLQTAGSAALLTSLILFIILVYDRTAFTAARYHFKLVGSFEVKDKILKPKKRIILHPGTDHALSVDTKLFHELAIGDKVHVERRLTGEILLIKKALPQRLPKT